MSSLRKQILLDIAEAFDFYDCQNNAFSNRLRSLADLIEEEKEKPKEGQDYWSPQYQNGTWWAVKFIWPPQKYSAVDSERFNAGDVYLSEADCQARIEELKSMMKKV